MSRLIVKISTALLAPVIIGAGCFVCIFRAAPVRAASAQMEQACAEYKMADQAQSISTAPAVSGMIMQNTGHDLGCQTKNDNTAFEIKSSSLLQDLDGQPVLLPAFDVNSPKLQYSFFDPLRKRPEKIDMITGCVFKLE